MSNFEYRILRRRSRWVMADPYDEWYRPVYRDFDTSAEARLELAACLAVSPGEYRLQRRPKTQAWKDIRV